MSKTAKYLTGAVIVLCVAAAFASRHLAPVAAPMPIPLHAQNAPSTTVLPTASTPDHPALLTAADDANTIPPLPSDATSVPDADLLKLSAIVNLPNAEERHIDKKQWNRALPIAQRLAQGPCDCEQRNWLVQFIQMGNDALAGSEQDYYRLAGVMRKTARNDKQLADNPTFFNR